MKKLTIMAILLAGLTACSSRIAVERPSDPAQKVVPVSMGHVKVYFIKTDNGYILVDTGTTDDEEKLDRAFAVAGVDPAQVRLIIITHAHPDHSGTVAYAKEITEADILCHEYEATFIRTGRSSPIIAQTGKGRFMNAVSPEWKYREAEPDILIKDEYDLSAYGIGGRIIPTPGHTQGSITIILESGEMLVGDLVRGKPANINLGMFYEDREVLVHSLADLVTRPSSRIYMSHGGQVDHALFEKAVRDLAEQD